MPDDLYDRDILIWSERQADLLRRLAAGERVNADVDWPNVIEEVHDVGLSEFKRCESLLRQGLIHLLKLHAWPHAASVSHWRGEVVGFLDDAADGFSPAMRRRLDLHASYRKARRRVLAAADTSEPALPIPETCPYTLDELLADDCDVDVLVKRLSVAE